MRIFLTIIIIFITIVYNLPLLVKVIKSKNTESLSLITLIFGIMMPFLWLLYIFLYLDDSLLIIVNIFCLIQNSFLLYYFFKFRKNEI
jgi:uncharacterized protein with PQ loop repeat